MLTELKKTTVVVESLSTTSTRWSVPEITSLLQDSTNRMRNLHQINATYFDKQTSILILCSDTVKEPVSSTI